ncbi:MAG: PCMD domain-containing protein [Prevotellaceae bacterium]|jgi:hypothetical protein|nr:PCMD domain-containing protein [Prevotellaceae bacterium]
MKKLLLFVILCSSCLVLSSCSNDDVVLDYAQDLSGTYKGNIIVSVPDVGETTELQKIILEYMSYNKMSVTLNNFSFPVGDESVKLGSIKVENITTQNSAGNLIYLVPTTVDIELDMIGTVNVTVGGTIVGKFMELDIAVTGTPVGDVSVEFIGSKMEVDNENTESKIISMVFEEAVVTGQPVINGTSILFFVSDAATDEDLMALTPVITVSEGATVYPQSGVPQDFSKGYVRYTVVAEDGIHKTIYTVISQARYDFDNWIDVEYTYSSMIISCQETTGWASSNAGIPLIKLFINTFEGIPVTASDDAHGGQKAAKLETFNTSGTLLVPYITPSSLFLGSFKLNIFNHLKSTMFGVPYDKEPVAFKGWYKYLPGDVYYVANPRRSSEATPDENMIDSCSIVAVLYEVTNMENDFLTGADLHTSDKVVMRAMLENGSKREEWTQFDMDFVLVEGRTYDPLKLYKLAIVCSSSRNGDKFCGAPGSVLIVDDFEIVSK